MTLASRLLTSAAIAALTTIFGFADQSSAAPTTTLSAPAYTVVEQIAGADGGWDFATVDPVRGRLYVARSNAVMRVDLSTGTVIPMLAPANGGHQVLVVRDGAEVLETDGKTNLARFIDAETGEVRAEIATGKKPDAALLEPLTSLVVVMNPGDGSVSFIDPATRTLVGSMIVGGSLEVGAADGKGLVYVNVEDRNEIAIIDAKTRTVIGRYPLKGCDGPTGLAFVAGGKRLISACANNAAVVSDPVSRRVTDTLTIGGHPDGVLYDEKRGLALIPTGEGFLEIVAAASPKGIKVIERVATAPSAKTAALDPRTGKVYLPSAHILSPVAPATRGVAEAGTFKVLVVAPSR